MSNFTNTKIKDTFQRVLQIDNGEIQDGLGLPVDARIQSIESDLGFTGDLDGTATLAVGLTSGDKIIQGNLDVIGKITAIEIYAQYESSSIIFSSGSTKFGNTFDDTHQFTGSVLITGSSFLHNGYNVITSNDTGSIVVNSASYATFAVTASYLLGSVDSASYAQTASYIQLSGVDGFTSYSSSVSSRVSSLENFSSSLDATFATDAQLNAYTASTNTRLNSLEIESGSIRSNFNTFTSSYNTDSSSFASRISTNTTNIANLASATSSYVLNSQTGSFILVSQTSSMSVASASYVNISGVDGFVNYSSSVSTRIVNLENFSSSLDATFATDAQLNAATASLSSSIASLSSSYLNTSSSFSSGINANSSSISALSSSFISFSASYNTGSFTGSFTGNLQGTSSWATNALTASFATSGGTPGGANTTIQFNDAGAFSGSGNFTFNKSTNTVSLTGSLVVTGSTTVSGSVGINTIADAQSLLHIDGGASVNRVIMDANNNVARIFSFRTDNSQRWAFRVDDNETGANAGANFQLRRYADNGSFIDAPISLNRSTGNITIIHPISASAGITGSLFGSSSFATTSSHALNAVSASFATQALSSSFASTASFAPNYVLTSVTSSMLAPYVLTSQTSSMSVASASVATSASYALTASFALNGGGGAAFPYTGSAIISGSLTVTGSANVQGAIGISRALIERAEITISASGLYTIYSAPTSSYRGIFADYTLISTNPAGNARAGNIMSVLSGSQVRYTETRTSDIGSTAGTTVQVSLSGGNLNLELNVATVTTTWNLVSLVRTI